jgi:tRNA threonylcarbamoyladenosine biosynthesis protein TsaB
MSRFLFIETSTSICSVALSENGKIIELKESSDEKAHARILAFFIQEILQKQNIKVEQLNAIVVSRGPGSYTGLRIGVATAKGLAYAANIPMIAISTLKAMAAGYSKQSKQENALIIPMIDARRMEVYSAVFNQKNEEIRGIQADIVDADTYAAYLLEQKVIFIGDGAVKCKETINNENAIFVENFNPSAAFMLELAEQKWLNKQFEDVAYFEPLYLKDFLAGIPKKNIFL